MSVFSLPPLAGVPLWPCLPSPQEWPCCLEVCVACRRPFEAGRPACWSTCQPEWVQEGQGKGRGESLEWGPEKAASFPTPTSAHLGAARLSERASCCCSISGWHGISICLVKLKVCTAPKSEPATQRG